LESSPIPVISDGAGYFIVLDADLSYGDDLVLNGTDSSSSNAGEKLIPNGTDATGTNDPSNNIVLNQDDNGDSNGVLLYEDDVPFDNLVLDGTNASSLHATEKVLFEDAGFDFSAGTTSITTAVASATIVHADIAKSEFNLGTTAEKTGAFGGIENLISEELIRIQDSFYYQDFSYEIQTNSGGSAYLNELKKSVHPAGFNVFAKVINTSLVSVAVRNAGTELGINDYDEDIYSAILASTFRNIFTETVQRRLGVINEEEDDILLESSIIQIEGDQFILEDETGDGFVQLETPENAYLDFEAIEITHGTDAGESGILLTEDLDRIVSERAVVISNNIVLDGTEDGHLPSSQDDAGSDLITEDDLSFGLEDFLQDNISFLNSESQSVLHNILDETSSETFVYDGKTDVNRDVFVRSSITTKLNTTINKTHNTSNGLSFLVTTAHEGITGDGIQLENGSAQFGSRLLIDGTVDLSTEGNPSLDSDDHILLEDSLDVNVGQSVNMATFTTFAAENLVDETDGDNLILENPVGFQGGGAILGDSYNPESYTITDLARSSLVNISDGNSLDTIVLEGQDIGTFKQEDETTVAGTFGDDILLEDYTGFGVGGKLILEREFIALEDSLGVGEKPFGMTGDTILEPFTMPSDIYVNENGKLTHEDDYDFIVYDTAVDENDQIVLEDGTDLDLYIAAVSSGVSIQTGFSGATTFDSASTFDLLKV